MVIQQSGGGATGTDHVNGSRLLVPPLAILLIPLVIPGAVQAQPLTNKTNRPLVRVRPPLVTVRVVKAIENGVRFLSRKQARDGSFREVGGGMVRGELYQILDMDVLRVLDAFEHFDPTAPDTSLYLRTCIRLHQPASDAWVYFLRERPNAPVIESGVWTHLSAD